MISKHGGIKEVVFVSDLNSSQLQLMNRPKASLWQ